MKELKYTKIIREKTVYTYHIVGEDNCISKTNFSVIKPEVFKEKQYEMMYDALSFAYSKKGKYTSLDDFMISFNIKDELTHGGNEDEILKKRTHYPFLKEDINLSEFNENIKLIINEYFEMNISQFIQPSWIFLCGKYYFNESSIILIGIEFDKAYWGICWLPYI